MITHTPALSQFTHAERTLTATQNKCDICIAQSLDLFERKEKARSLEIKQAGDVMCKVLAAAPLILQVPDESRDRLRPPIAKSF